MKIYDITPLQHATNTTWLSLVNQSVTDISALAGMKKLVHLDLRNQVGDGAEGPASKVTDISALKERTNLTWVDLRASKLGNVDAMLGLVNMESLNVFAAHISDFSGLRNMTKLKRLEAHNNPATDLSPLANLTALEELQAGGLSTASGGAFLPKIRDLHFVENLKNLKSLDLSYTDISDLRPLMGLQNLQELMITNSALQVIEPILYLPKLNKLWLNNNPVGYVNNQADYLAAKEAFDALADKEMLGQTDREKVQAIFNLNENAARFFSANTRQKLENALALLQTQDTVENPLFAPETVTEPEDPTEPEEPEVPEEPEEPEEPEPFTQARVSFEANGGRFRRGAKTNQMTYEQEQILPTRSAFGLARPGYTFAGWRVQGTQEVLTPGSSYTLSGDTVFEAVWESATGETEPANPEMAPKEVLYRLDPNGGRVRRGTQTERKAEAGTVITLSTRSDLGLARSGYTFAGWQVSDTEEMLKPGAPYTLTEGTEFKAVWEKI